MAPRVLEKAKAGVYSQFEVQRGLAIQRLVTHFDQTGDQWRIKPNLRSMVTFQKQNLLENFTGLGTFDVIFCRNVLIYFDAETKKRVLQRLAAQTGQRRLSGHGRRGNRGRPVPGLRTGRGPSWPLWPVGCGEVRRSLTPRLRFRDQKKRLRQARRRLCMARRPRPRGPDMKKPGRRCPGFLRFLVRPDQAEAFSSTGSRRT